MIPRLLVLASAFLFSTAGAAIKATSLNSWQIAGFRCGIGLAALLLFLPETRRGWTWRIVPGAIALATTFVLFVSANKLTTAASTIFIQYTAPVHLLLLGPWLLREPIRRADLALIAAVAIGMSCFFIGSDRASATAPNPALGNLLAAGASVTWALTLACLRWSSRAAHLDSSLQTVALGCLITFIGCLPAALPGLAFTARDAAILAYLGVFQIGLSYFCLTRGMRQVGAFEASTLLLSEPAMNPLWAWLIHGETPGAWALGGGAMILSATLVNTWWRNGKRWRASISAPSGLPPRR